MMEGSGPVPTSSPINLDFVYLVNSLAQLLDVARLEIERDREVAKKSLAIASSILRSEIERHSGVRRSTPAGLAPWQASQVRAFINKNLHRTIHVRDLSFVARQSPAHFARSFKLTFGEPPHAYIVKRRLEKACHLMMTSFEPLSDVALSVGFSDQAHLNKLFRQAFGQSPANWRRERSVSGGPLNEDRTSRDSARTEQAPQEWLGNPIAQMGADRTRDRKQSIFGLRYLP
jgi:AraC family transcriptional regulator